MVCFCKITLLLIYLVQVEPTGRVLETEFTTRLKKKEPPVFVDQLKLIQTLNAAPEVRFYYMIYAVDRSSEFFNPYALK